MAAIVHSRMIRLYAGPRSIYGSFNSSLAQSYVTAELTSESIALSAASDGTVASYFGAETTLTVRVGGRIDTSNWTITRIDSLGVQSSLAGNKLTVTSLTTDVAYVTLTATQPGYDPITKQFTVSRVKRGADGSAGDALDIIFTRALAQPATPTLSASVPSGWYSDVASVPAGSGFIWSCVGTKASGSTTYIWNTPLKIEGSDGASGLSIVELTIFSRAASAPATPTGGTYSFSTKTLTPPSGWSVSVPSGTDPVYTSRATVSSTDPAATSVAVSGWTASVVSFQNGAAGQGQVKAVAFIRSTAASVAAPTGGSFSSPTPTTAGWSDGVPAGVEPLWQSTRIFTSDGLAPHQAAWTTPQKVANTSAVKYQFSIDNATWSDTASVDSVYMRTGTSADGGTTWTYSAGVKVKGEQGPQGLQGQQGFQGSPGTRGSVTAYASGSSWNNSTASSAIYTQTGTYYLVIGDTVTISNNSSYAETRYWSGTGWVSPGVIIDGNLLVSGTISGNKINGGTITGTTIQTAAGGKRIVISASTNKLQAFNASGSSLVELGGSTGSVYATADGSAAAIYGAGGPINYGGYFTSSVTGNEYAAVRGEGLSNANGVRGGNSTSGYWGAIGTPSYAGYFSGPVYITGALYVGGVQITGGGGGSAGVSSFNSRTGAVSLTASDVTSALGSTYVQNASYASSAGNANTATTATTATASVNSDATKSVRSDTNNYNLRVGTDGNPTVYSGTGIGTVWWSGQYGWVSDRARKTNIQDTTTSGLDVVRALRVVDYSWKQSDVLYDGKTHTGFIAQEVQSVAPDAVGEVNGSLMMNLGTLVPHLVKAIQELSAEVESLKSQLQGNQP